jgi:hypothetical protein
LIRVDGADTNLIEPAHRQFGWCVAVVSRPAVARGFQVLPPRWVAERTISWFGR